MLEQKSLIKKFLRFSVLILVALILIFSFIRSFNNSYVLLSSNISPTSTCSLNNGNCASCYNLNGQQCLTGSSEYHKSPASCTESGKGCSLYSSYINPAINLLSGLVVLVAIVSIIIAGIMYSSSGGDPQKTAKAKSRIINTLLALLAYIFLYSFLQFIIPGGLLNK